MIIFVVIIDLIRLELASKGNKTNDIKALVWSCCLSVPTIVAFSFFLRLQSYVYVRLFFISHIVFILFEVFSNHSLLFTSLDSHPPSMKNNCRWLLPSHDELLLISWNGLWYRSLQLDVIANSIGIAFTSSEIILQTWSIGLFYFTQHYAHGN